MAGEATAVWARWVLVTTGAAAAWARWVLVTTGAAWERRVGWARVLTTGAAVSRLLCLTTVAAGRAWLTAWVCTRGAACVRSRGAEACSRVWGAPLAAARQAARARTLKEKKGQIKEFIILKKLKLDQLIFSLTFLKAMLGMFGCF